MELDKIVTFANTVGIWLSIIPKGQLKVLGIDLLGGLAHLLLWHVAVPQGLWHSSRRNNESSFLLVSFPAYSCLHDPSLQCSMEKLIFHRQNFSDFFLSFGNGTSLT